MATNRRFLLVKRPVEMFTDDWGGAGPDGQETVPTGVRRSLGNTLYMAIGLPLGMMVGLGLAMLLDSRVPSVSIVNVEANTGR